jgi:hypothetical protein
MRLLTDESVIRAYAAVLNDGHDVRRSVDEVPEGASDGEVDEAARRTERVLVTRDTSALGRDADRGVVVFDVQSGLTPDRVVGAVADIEAAYDDQSEIREVFGAWL